VGGKASGAGVREKGAEWFGPYSHQLNSISEAPACRFFPPRAVAPERGGAEETPLQKNAFSRLFPAWFGALAGGLRPHGAGEGLKIDFFGGAVAPPSHPGDAGPRFRIA